MFIHLMVLEPALNNHADLSVWADLYKKCILRLNLNIPHSSDPPPPANPPPSLLIYINARCCNKRTRLLPPFPTNVHADKGLYIVQRVLNWRSCLEKPFVMARYLVYTSISAQSAFRGDCACLISRCCRFAVCPVPAVPVTFNYHSAPRFNVLHSGSVFMCVFQLSPWQSKYPPEHKVAILITVGSV